jgi:hypothetical protein
MTFGLPLRQATYLLSTSQINLPQHSNLDELIQKVEMLLLQHQIPSHLEKTWTQPPLIFTDAHLRRFPIHLEYVKSCKIEMSANPPISILTIFREHIHIHRQLPFPGYLWARKDRKT